MSRMELEQDGGRQQGCSRRDFLGTALGAAGSVPLWAATGIAADAAARDAEPALPQRKIKLGMVGCGGRGTWITPLFLKHGGYELHAAADYFPSRVEKYGEKFGIDPSRRFSGLSGYRKVIDSGAEAVAFILPPGFSPEYASAAVDAGKHVYLAKPVAPDVPGCLRILAAGKLATQKKQAFLVDYQIPTDPNNQYVVAGVRAGAIGKIAKLSTFGTGGGGVDAPKTANLESRLENGSWEYDIALSGGWSVVFDIHAIDAAIWLLGQRPVVAHGLSRIVRDDPHGDSCDASSYQFEYADGVIHEHSGLALPTGEESELACRVHGQVGWALIPYTHKARLQPRGKKPFAEPVDGGSPGGLYKVGAMRNIATFHQNVTTSQFDNPTVQRAVDGCLTCILGREAAARRERLTMEALLRENKRYEMDLTGLKV